VQLEVYRALAQRIEAALGRLDDEPDGERS